MLVEEQQQRRAVAAVAPLSEEKERPSEEVGIFWDAPPPGKSHHQDDFHLNGIAIPVKPLFATGTGWRVCLSIFLSFSLSVCKLRKETAKRNKRSIHEEKVIFLGLGERGSELTQAL